MVSRRRLLASVASAAAVTGCVSLPAGSTPDETDTSTRTTQPTSTRTTEEPTARTTRDRATDETKHDRVVAANGCDYLKLGETYVDEYESAADHEVESTTAA